MVSCEGELWFLTKGLGLILGQPANPSSGAGHGKRLGEAAELQEVESLIHGGFVAGEPKVCGWDDAMVALAG